MVEPTNQPPSPIDDDHVDADANVDADASPAPPPIALPVQTPIEPLRHYGPAASAPDRLGPRIWPSVVVACVSPVVLLVVSIVCAAVGAFYLHVTGAVDFKSHVSDAEWIAASLNDPVTTALVVFPGQITVAALVLVAYFSRQKLTDRLGLRASHISPIHWPILALGMLGISEGLDVASDVLFGEPEGSLELIGKMVLDTDGISLAMVMLSITVFAPVFEELLFRGYIQTRLLKRWSPWQAIGFTSLWFGVMHLDPRHSLLAAIMGVYLGVVAWRCGSVWPAVLCHFVVNLMATVLTRAVPDEVYQHPDFRHYYLAIMSVLGIAFVASCVILARLGSSEPPADSSDALDTTPQPAAVTLEPWNETPSRG